MLYLTFLPCGLTKKTVAAFAATRKPENLSETPALDNPINPFGSPRADGRRDKQMD
jgi:hypothetical protein